MPSSQKTHRASLFFLALAVLTLLPSTARADLGVVIADPTNLGGTRYTVPGHALVYLSGVCAETPIHARLCRPGEQGSVISAYPNFHEAQPYNWNIVPFSLYRTGSLIPDARLLYASKFVKQALELHARKTFLSPVCPEDSCPQIPHSYWRDLVAATADRDLFIYTVHTTPGQDQAAVDWINRQPNQNHYNAFSNNCADFAASLINTIFPHSIHRDLLNDVGLMSPKAAAHSFTHWALKQPELGFYILHFAQLPGDIRRGGIARSGTETVIYMKKYIIPAVVLGDFELPTAIVASYVFTGRFDLYKQFSLHPASSIEELEPHENTSTANNRNKIIGTPEEWISYRQQFTEILSSPEAQNILINHKNFFAPKYSAASAFVDPQGRPWLLLNTSGSRRVGINSDNLLDSTSDPEAAFHLMLGRVAYALAAKNHMRETIEEFHLDWSLLQQTQSRLRATRTASAPASIIASPEPTQ